MDLADGIDKAMKNVAKRQTAALPGVGAVATPQRNAGAAPAGRASAGGPLTEATGRLLVGAVRVLAEVQAHRVSLTCVAHAFPVLTFSGRCYFACLA